MMLAAVLAACRPTDAAPAASSPDRAPVGAVGMASRASGPRPGERVRQPELDGYCVEAQRPSAFYYHGGMPSVRVAHKDACAPLYLTECEAEGRCYPPRDQEPGMWCCAASEAQPAAHATR